MPKTMLWQQMHRRATTDLLGFIPEFLREDDPRPAREQFHANYRHGGGWRPFKGFTLVNGDLVYPGDPPARLLWETRLHDKETIQVFEHSWVAVFQEDGTYEICRMD